MISNASLFSINQVTPIAVQPIKLGIDVNSSEGLRPKLSADQPAINPPSVAPIGDMAWKERKD